MGKIHRRFDLQFKNEICQSIQSGTTTVKETCQVHQLREQLVYTWLAKFRNGELQKRTPDRLAQLERENEKLKAKIGELTMTVDFLKKMEIWKKQQTNERLPVITPKNLAQFQRPASPLGSQDRATTTGPKEV